MRHLLAVQAQDRAAARLALRARIDGLTAADVERELGPGGALVAGWLLRGTLHLAARDDFAWLLGLAAPAIEATNVRRLAQEGVAPAAADRALEVVERALADRGPQTRAELRAVLDAAGLRTAGQALPHLLLRCALRGVLVVGPLRDGAAAYVLARDWLGAPPPLPLAGDARDRALGELGRRYLTGHAPASDRDLARWAGLPLRDARGALAAAGPAAPATERGPVPPRLLPAFDPYLLGWGDRSFAVPPAHARAVHPGGGILRATATVDGAVAGTWDHRGLHPFDDARLSPAARRALEAELRDVARFATPAR